MNTLSDKDRLELIADLKEKLRRSLSAEDIGRLIDDIFINLMAAVINGHQVVVVKNAKIAFTDNVKKDEVTLVERTGDPVSIEQVTLPFILRFEDFAPFPSSIQPPSE